ncbi:MAG: GFA family protein [Alphaproteobacteria bacterium]|nr:GFA family protein [Alphaproteobacteria bacterium]
MSEIEGQCLCGAIRFRLSGGLRNVVVCHCSQCRRWHGHVGAYTRVAKVDLKVEGDVAWFRSSELARRGFCRGCGSSLFWERLGTDMVSVAAGSLDEPTGLRTTLQIFAEDAGDYYEIDDRISVRPPRSAGA